MSIQHEPWCARTAAEHSVCYRLVADIAAAPGLRLLVEVNRARNVPTLVSVAVDRGQHRQVVPLSAVAADSLGTALTEAARMAGEV